MNRFILLAACGCMVASALVFRPFTAYDDLGLAVVLLIAGAGLVGVAGWDGKGRFTKRPYEKGGFQDSIDLFKAPIQSEEGRSMLRPYETSLVHWVMAGAGVVLLVLLAAVNGGILKNAATTDAQFGLLVTGVLLVILGFGVARVRLERVDALAVGAITLLTLIALVLRLWQINQTVRFFVDELSYSTAVQNMWARDTVELLAPMEGMAAFPNLFAYFEVKTVSLLGRNFAGFRAASALAGALSVPALYLLADAVFKRRVALVAAALLVTFPPHLHFTRLGIIEATGALAGLAALAFLMRGLMNNRRLDWTAGGALLGLTQYFHEGARVLFTPVAGVTIILLIVIWRLADRRRNVLLAGGLAVIVALPIYTTLSALQFSAVARLNTPYIALNSDYWRELFASGDFYWHIRWHIIEPFLLFVHQPERGLFYAGQTPMVLDFVVPAFLLGVGVVVWRWRRPGALMLMVWLLAAIFGNTLLLQSTIMTRYVVVFSAVVMLAAVGLWLAVEVIRPRERSGRSTASPLQLTVMGVVVLVMSVAQVRYYFDWHVPLYNVQFRSNWGHRDAQDAVLRSRNFPPGTQVYIVSRLEPDLYHTHGLMGFQRSDLTLRLMRPEDVSAEFLDALHLNVDQAFFIEPNEPALLERIQARFNVGEPLFSPYDLPTRDQFALYYVQAQ